MSRPAADGKPRAPPAGGWRDWDAFLARTPATGFMQTSWWAEFRALADYTHFGLVMRDRGRVIGGATVLRYAYAPGRAFYYVPEGPVLPDDRELAAAVLDAVLESIDERRRADPDLVSHLRIEPRWERLPEQLQDFAPVPPFMDPYMEPRDTLCVDLRPDETALLALMQPKGRYNVGVARRHGVRVTEDRGGLEVFLALYRETCARQGLAPKGEDYFRSLLATLTGHDAGSLYFAECDGRRLATAILVWFGARGTYFFGASSGQRRNVMAPYLLHFELMRCAKARGCAWYDFWGVAPCAAADHPWRGIGEFKRKFGGVDVTLVRTLDRVYDRDAYRDYLAAEGDPWLTGTGQAGVR